MAAVHCRRDGVPPEALRAATRALAAEAVRLAGAPLVHDLAAAAPPLLAAALAGELPAAPANPDPDPGTGPSAAWAGSTASPGRAGAGAGAPGGREQAGRPRQRASKLLPGQAAAESRRLLV